MHLAIIINQWHGSACNHGGLKMHVHVLQVYKWSKLVYTNFHIGKGYDTY